jgi:hypothetical protein
MTSQRWPEQHRRLEQDALEIVEVSVAPRPKLWPFGLLGNFPPAPTVRMFSDSQLSDQVGKLLASLPDDRRAAVLEVGADKSGIQAVAAAKIGAGWTLVGILDKRFAGEWSGQVQVRWSA